MVTAFGLVFDLMSDCVIERKARTSNDWPGLCAVVSGAVDGLAAPRHPSRVIQPCEASGGRVIRMARMSIVVERDGEEQRP